MTTDPPSAHARSSAAPARLLPFLLPLFIGLSLVVEMVCALDQGLGSVAYHSIVSEPKDFPCFFGAVVMFLLVVWAAQFAHWAVRDVWLYRHTGRYLVES